MSDNEIQTVGDFELLELLGKGEMGEVYKARQRTVNRLVALKILPLHLARNPDYIARFHREIGVAASLNHPNIVHLHTAGEDQGTYYYAMEYVEGITLKDRLDQETKLPLVEAVSAMIQAAHGLNHAWERGKIVHRDIKPENLLLSQEGIIKIADLGLAKPTEGDVALTIGQRVWGTPHYISPEQVGSDREIDFRSDIYSLGATLFHLLTGQVPYPGNSTMVIMTRHLRDPVPDPRARDPQLDPKISNVVMRMMAKDKNDRYPSYMDLILELEPFVMGPLPKKTLFGRLFSR